MISGCDMIVNLTNLPEMSLSGCVKIKRAFVGDKETILDFVESNFQKNRVWSILKEDDEYLEVFAPDFQYSEAPITATISENLADIYQDLKNFISVYADRNEECMEAALFKVQDNFKNYWGQKLVNAMRPLHECLYKERSFE